MHKGRIEAFTDAVIAIILTIMVLELRPPHGASWTSLFEDKSEFIAYLLSFVHVGIYWNNHHHLFQSVRKVSGAVLWANLAVLFCLSLIPFANAWMGEQGFAPTPVLFYGIVLLGSALTYYILCLTLVAANGPDSPVAKGLGQDYKGKMSPVIYIIGIAISSFLPWLACVCYAIVALIWLIPDPRFERQHWDK